MANRTIALNFEKLEGGIEALPKRTLRVFIASPGDLAPERRAFKEQLDQMNVGFGDGAGVEFVAVGWEDTLATTGRRVQSVINQEIDTCDVFVLAMFRRWGQAAPDFGLQLILGGGILPGTRTLQ